MVGLVLRAVITVTLCHWAYAEFALAMPGAVPAVDRVLAQIQIPTHDQWDKEAIAAAAEKIAAISKEVAGNFGAEKSAHANDKVAVQIQN